MIAALVRLRLSKGGTSACHNMCLKGLHLGSRVVCRKDVRLAFGVVRTAGASKLVRVSHRSIFRLGISATGARNAQLRVLLAEILADHFKVFSLLLVAGELGANVFSSFIVVLRVLLHQGTASSTRALRCEALRAAQSTVGGLLLI